MSAFALVTGILYRGPEQRTSKTGKPFVTATLKAKDDDGTSSPLRLREGESLSVQGKLQSGEYEKDGQKHVSLGVVADHVLALRTGHTPMETYPVRQPAKQRAHDMDEPREPAFNDGIPW
jgi:hypothetical protein